MSTRNNYHTYPSKKPMMDVLDSKGVKRERELYPDAPDGFIAVFGSIGSWGETEQEATENLILQMMSLAAKGKRKEQIAEFEARNK
jgi:hypothetical protein